MKQIDIFKTNIQHQSQAQEVLNVLKKAFPNSKMNFDLEDSDKILRIENPPDSSLVVSTMDSLGFTCKVIPDKICYEITNTPGEMEAFWDASFIQYKAMWGFEPTQSALIAKDLFVEKGVKKILLPGIGYGRNGQVFIENGIQVTGIEISQTAIELAREHYGNEIPIFHGSVTDMPFDDHKYQGIFCYGLLYLLNEEQRKKMIQDCYDQLEPGGWMIFSVVSKNSSNYGKGKEVSKDTFEVGKGGYVYFYDLENVRNDFQNFGLIDFFEIVEQKNALSNRMELKFILIKCNKEKHS